MKACTLLGVCVLLSACGTVREHEVKDEFVELRQHQIAITEQCHRDLEAANLGTLQGKAEVWRTPLDAPVPFAILNNDTFASAEDRPVIQRWAEIRDHCIQQMIATMTFPPHANRMTRDFLAAQYAVIKEAESWVGNLIVALYQQKITYAEFAQKRLASGQEQSQTLRAMENAQRRSDDAAIAAARDQFNQSLVAWSTYLQGLQARQPQTVYVTVR